jgi:hypothetical protein
VDGYTCVVKVHGMEQEMETGKIEMKMEMGGMDGG